MSVHSTNCNPVFSHSSGSEPESVFNLNSLIWGCGVTDIIGGFEPLDPGSTPGTLAGLSLLNGCVNVADITWDCDSLDLGSIPSTPAKSQQNKKGEIKMIKNKIKKKMKTKQNEGNFDAQFVCINGVSRFREHPHRERVWNYMGRAPVSMCMVIEQDDWVEIHNVIVHKPSQRSRGNGTAMIADIRQAFPDHHIWVNTGECSRGFWEKMVERGHIDSIENEYWWPCWDTTCHTCHPTRKTGKRRDFSW